MPNHINSVANIRKEKALGYPKGTSDLHNAIPYLLARIDELENALTPFARVALSDKDNPTPPLMSQVYTKDCRTAFDALDPAQSVQSAQQRRDANDSSFFSVPAE
jgi:hypothetical protein